MASTTSSGARLHLVSDPVPGQVVRLPAGDQLEVHFGRRGLGGSTWTVDQRPGHLVPLAESGHDFRFLVFGAPADSDVARPLRLVRRVPHQSTPREVLDLVVVPTAS